MLTHVVMFKLKQHGDRGALAARLTEMRGNIPGLERIEIGVDALGDARAWDLVLITEFADEAALASYRDHPLHREVLDYIAGVVERAAVVDYRS